LQTHPTYSAGEKGGHVMERSEMSIVEVSAGETPARAVAAVPNPPTGAMSAALPLRDGTLTVAALCDLYMAQYAGRDRSIVQRLNWWRAQLEGVRLAELSDDHLHLALEGLARQASRFYAGKDADGRPIFKPRRAPMSGSTVNRYISAIAAVLTWAIRRRIAPKGFDHPARRLEYQPEHADKTRFLSDDERERLLAACKASKWPRLYLLVLLALTTGARKGELVGLRWRDIDLTLKVLHVVRSKNGDSKVLPLVPAALEQLQQLQGAPGGLVFPSRLDPTKPMAFESRWHQALKEARIRAFRFHDCRHSCASYLAQHGATLLEIGDLLGHRQASMTKRYAHLAAGHRSALVDRVMGDMR
jgi:integrase